ncbi:piwi-like protein Siwi [Penaeus indicus]|uniref:piwi-like protein Siwi n=1 Tax=Penaeus indicus TaxID=29960 RepID=UPI00300CCEFD
MFSPEEDRTGERKRLVRQHREALGGNYLFDGMQLYLPHKLGSEVTELSSKRESDGSAYQIKIKFIKELSTMDSQGLQIMNIKLRQWLEHLGLQLIGRNHFNPKAAARDERYK